MVITSCGLSKLVKGYWFNMKHNQLSKNVEHIGHTHQKVSYGVQPINNVECEFFYQGDKRMSKGTRVCDVIKEKISNGMLPHK